jgi:hypothetical protein
MGYPVDRDVKQVEREFAVPRKRFRRVPIKIKERIRGREFMIELDEDEQFYRDTERVAFPKLDDRQLGLLEPLGVHRSVRRGESVFKAGQRDMPLAVVLSGALEALESRDG